MRPIPGNQTREQNLSQSKSKEKTLFGRFNFSVTINRKQLAKQLLTNYNETDLGKQQEHISVGKQVF